LLGSRFHLSHRSNMQPRADAHRWCECSGTVGGRCDGGHKTAFSRAAGSAAIGSGPTLRALAPDWLKMKNPACAAVKR
jgi:hypothetical protein